MLSCGRVCWDVTGVLPMKEEWSMFNWGKKKFGIESMLTRGQ